ncbi:hypothetical protein [Pontibacillus sp. HMF3514]|uniref:hypothetical protein n=1 Tax=Pontibacillus sp. HMF3514 TaxID=2692425 RepID=UPI00131FB925|nr:hypothetical protein [Pontibacillus sp. HMF3514]QHE52830.1 hypothetical protein GS400_12715 [Pontibacillus sp. HMF3514]
MSVFILTGCNNLYKDSISYSQKELLERYTDMVEDGYAINYFYERESSLPSEIWDLQKYEKWSRLSLHGSEKSNRINMYKEAFNESEYPFYIVVSRNGLELQTTSVEKVVQFFERNGGEIN